MLITLDGLPQQHQYTYWPDGNLQYDREYGPDATGTLASYRSTFTQWGVYRVDSGAPPAQKYLFRPQKTLIHRAADDVCIQGLEYDYGGGYAANPTAAGDLVGQRTALANLHCGAGDGYTETRFTYDAWGNRTQAETLIGGAGSASNPKTTTVYDSLGVLPVAQTVVTGGSDLVTSTTYDAYGRPRETAAPNGVTRRQTYDAWGRLCLVERAPAGGGYAAQQATAYSDAWRLPGGCADAANFADGSGGLNTLPLTLVEGEAFTSQSGMIAWDAKAAASGGYVLGAGWGGAAGNYAQYDALSFGWASGSTLLRLRYANNTGHANTLQVFVDGVAKGSITCEHTGGWGDQSRDYREVTLDLGSIAPGSHSLKLSVTVAGAYTNVDRFTLTGGGLRVVGVKAFGPAPAGAADPVTGGQFSYAYHDGLGRPVTVQTEHNTASGAAWATTHQEYDSLGRVIMETLPYATTTRSGSSPNPNPNPQRTMAYDALGRVVSQTEPNGATTSLAYYYARWDTDWDFMGGRRAQQLTDAAGNIIKRTAYDAFGRVTSVTEFPNGYGAYPEYRTRYTYDVLDRLTQVQDALGNVTTLTYNGAGWKLALTDPDMGAWSYRYDKAGRLVQQRDAKQQRTCTYYDRAGRVTGTQYLTTDCPASQPTPPHVALSYDSCANGAGQMCSQTMTYSANHTITLVYDTSGRLSQETRVISAGGSGTYRTQYTYDAQDRPATIIYPDATGSGGAGESVTTTYDAGGRPYSLTVNGTALAQTTLYTAGGAVYRQTLGNGRCTQNDYDVNQRLQRRRVGSSCGQGTLLDLTYTYDLVDNVASIQNALANTTTTFVYDLRLQRLTGASGEYNATYAYDAVGNLTRKIEGSQALTLTYNAAQPAHGVKAVNGVALQYDATGNLTRTLASGVVYTQTWDRVNRLAMVTTGNLTVTFGYDAAGALAVKTVRQGSAVTTTHYIGGYYERIINGATRRYYRLGDQFVLYDGTAYHYLYGDHLNSATLTTNASGAKTSETRYYPYGAHRYDWGSDPSDRDFTGQRRDAEIALLDYVARRYSPYLGRFVSPDSIVPQPGNPQSLNRYAYVLNNPLRYTDPSGHCIGPLFWHCVSTGAALTVYAELYYGPHAGAALFGTGPDSRGLRIASAHQGLIESTSGVQPILVAAGIAVQSQWGGFPQDWVEVNGIPGIQDPDTNASLGIASMTPNEMQGYGGNALNPADAVSALTAKIQKSVAACTGCSATDQFIVAGIAQNGFDPKEVSGALGFPGPNGTINWSRYFAQQSASSGGIKARWLGVRSGGRSWNLFQLQLFLNDVMALIAQGWTPPADVNLGYVQCLVSGGSDCKQ